MKNKLFVGIFCVGLTGLAHAAIIPTGIQTNVSNAQIANWGWTECSRSASNGNYSTSSVISACNGDYLAMGVWDASLGAYGVVGIGDRGTVTTITYANYQGDDNSTAQNWSNGLNWYRTSGFGSWGFTTSQHTSLSSADVDLYNTGAAGLSFHLDGNGNFHDGWGYDASGNNFQFIYDNGDQRVFWTANQTANAVSEPSTVAILGLGLLGMVATRRRLRKGG